MESREFLLDRMTENLPVFRKKLKLSQDNLAQIIGSSRYTVMLIETGKRRMTWNTFLSLILLFEKMTPRRLCCVHWISIRRNWTGC